MPCLTAQTLISFKRSSLLMMLPLFLELLKYSARFVHFYYGFLVVRRKATNQHNAHLESFADVIQCAFASFSRSCAFSLRYANHFTVVLLYFCECVCVFFLACISRCQQTPTFSNAFIFRNFHGFILTRWTMYAQREQNFVFPRLWWTTEISIKSFFASRENIPLSSI